MAKKLSPPEVMWALDGMRATRSGGRRVRTLTLLDDGVRDGLALDVDTALPAERVIRVREHVTAWRGQPQAMRLDNGPEFLADRVAPRCADRGLALRYLQPGQPNPPAVVERFNRTFHHEGRAA